MFVASFRRARTYLSEYHESASIYVAPKCVSIIRDIDIAYAHKHNYTFINVFSKIYYNCLCVCHTYSGGARRVVGSKIHREWETHIIFVVRAQRDALTRAGSSLKEVHLVQIGFERVCGWFAARKHCLPLMRRCWLY